MNVVLELGKLRQNLKVIYENVDIEIVSQINYHGAIIQS